MRPPHRRLGYRIEVGLAGTPGALARRQGVATPLQVRGKASASDAVRDWAVIALDRSVDRPVFSLGSPFDTAADDTLIIIQHPLGGPKQVAIDYLSVKHVDADVVQYLADTQKGSSGSPVSTCRCT